jgi:uncharacterized protein (TIRG00374 family)
LVEVPEAIAKPRGRTARVRAAAVRTAIGLAVGAVLVLTFLKMVGASAVYQRLAHLNVGAAALCGATFFLAYVIRALRWRYLLRPRRVTVRLAVAIYQIAIFLNWLLPIRGGELAMSLLLRRTSGIPVSESLAAVSMDKAMDLLPSFGLLAVLPFVGLEFSRPLWLVLAGAVVAGCFGLAFVVLAAIRRDWAVAFFARPFELVLRGELRRQIRPFVAGFTDTLVALFKRPRILLVAAAYTAVAVTLDAIFCLLAFRAVGVTLPFLIVLYGYTLFNLSFILPSPPGQVGSNELIGLLIFSGVFRVSKTGVGAMFLFSHPFTGILMACTGLACLSAMSLSLRGTLRLTAEGSGNDQQARGADGPWQEPLRGKWRREPRSPRARSRRAGYPSARPQAAATSRRLDGR